MLFDLDSTLVASSEAIMDAIKEVLESKGLTCSRAEAVKMCKAQPSVSLPQQRCVSFSLLFRSNSFPKFFILEKGLGYSLTRVLGVCVLAVEDPQAYTEILEKIRFQPQIINTEFAGSCCWGKMYG